MLASTRPVTVAPSVISARHSNVSVARTAGGGAITMKVVPTVRATSERRIAVIEPVVFIGPNLKDAFGECSSGGELLLARSGVVSLGRRRRTLSPGRRRVFSDDVCSGMMCCRLTGRTLALCRGAVEANRCRVRSSVPRDAVEAAPEKVALSAVLVFLLWR